MVKREFTARDRERAIQALRILGVIGLYQQPSPEMLRDAAWEVVNSSTFGQALRSIGERHKVKHTWWKSLFRE
jgi:hypothetical protein